MLMPNELQMLCLGCGAPIEGRSRCPDCVAELDLDWDVADDKPTVCLDCHRYMRRGFRCHDCAITRQRVDRGRPPRR